MRLGWSGSETRWVLTVEREGRYYAVERLMEFTGLELGDPGSALLDPQARGAIRRALSAASAGQLDAVLLQPECFAPPVRPRQVVAIGLNYRGHADEMGAAYPVEPVVFAKAPSAVIGSGQPIVLPRGRGQVHYEGEVAIVLGQAVGGERAGLGIAGYTLLNDVTMRDMQSRAGAAGLPWFLSKSVDTFCPLGPLMTPVEDVSAPQELEFMLSVNDVQKQRGCLSDLIFPVPKLLEYVAQFVSLEPGDVIATGTPSGVGPLEPGDLVAIESEVLGRLANSVREAVS